MTQNPIRMLTINEAAERVPGLTKYRVREMCLTGELPCIKAGRKYLICEQVLISKLTQPDLATNSSANSNTIRRIEN